jgi:hypothetical protein
VNQVVPDHVTCTNTGAWIFHPSKGEQALELVHRLMDVLASAELPESVLQAIATIRRSA